MILVHIRRLFAMLLAAVSIIWTSPSFCAVIRTEETELSIRLEDSTVCFAGKCYELCEIVEYRIGLPDYRIVQYRCVDMKNLRMVVFDLYVYDDGKKRFRARRFLN